MDLNLSGVDLERLVTNSRQLLEEQGHEIPSEQILRRSIERVLGSRLDT